MYKSLLECVLDLEKNRQLVRIREEVDPYLEMAEIHRRVHQAQGPAVFFEKVKNSSFPAVSNLFGTYERARFIFRSTLENVKKLVQLKAEAGILFKKPFSFLGTPLTGLHALPIETSQAPVFAGQTTLSALPQIQSWPLDGGPFILLPQVYTEHPDRPGILNSNLGMYRIQMAGNRYVPNQEAGLHYQIRRDIGIHHTAAMGRGEPLKVSVFMGGPPAHTFAAVMYLPEGMPEVAFAGALAGRNFRYIRRNGYVLSAEADFCITGTVQPGVTKPEGPFGDHLGYYSLQHEFPVLKVEKIYHRKDAIWPFTVVGRPPQEDSVFGRLVQEIAGPMVSREIPGVKALHAVDAAGVHPLLLAIGSERYAPYLSREPREILTQAHAILGYGPCSLAKYLIIAAGQDQPSLNIHHIAEFFQHVLERVDWKRDLHFETRTTMDTLDYSGTGLNAGSKVVIAAAGPKKRELLRQLPSGISLPDGYTKPKLAMPGVLVIQSPKFVSYEQNENEKNQLKSHLENQSWLSQIPWIVLVDDSEFTSSHLNHFLWVTFTRSNPSHDIDGIESFIEHKHWGCAGPLFIDARIKPHHAPPLEEDKAVTQKVEQLARRGGSLEGIF